MNYQRLILDTLAGKKEIAAPAGWDFDKTAIITWAKLLELVDLMHTERGRPARRTKAFFHRLDGQIQILSEVLASALGNAAPYWYDQARSNPR